MFCFVGGECLGLCLCPHGFTQAPRELPSSQAQGSVGGLQQGSAGMHVLVGPFSFLLALVPISRGWAVVAGGPESRG